MIPYVETKIYDWFDIQTEICKRLGITNQEFRQLPHPEDEYRDLWHVFTDVVIPKRMRNDTYVDLYALDRGWFDNPIVYSSGRPEKVPEWSLPALSSYNDIFYELLGCTPEEYDCKSIVVKFSW